MDEKKKQKLLKLARVADRGELGLLEYLYEIEEKIEDAIPNFTELLKRIKGDKGDSPSKEELLDLIKPLIPQPENGKTPTKQELLDLITPLIPKVKDGKSPTKEDLLKIIKPLIPKISTEEIKQDVYDELSEEVKSLIPNRLEIEKGIKESIIEELPNMGEIFRDGLDKLEEDKRLDISSLKGWAKTEEGILNRAVSIVDNRTSFLINKVSNLSEKVDNINPVETQDLQAVTDLGSTTTNTITVIPDSVTYTIGDVENGSATQVSGYGHYAYGNSYTFTVFAGKTVGGDILWSENGYEINFTDDGSYYSFAIELDFDAVVDAEVYRVVVDDPQYGYSNNRYFDTTSINFIYDPNSVSTGGEPTRRSPLSFTGPAFMVDGGTSSQFLKADGSYDDNTYLTEETQTIDNVLEKGNTTTRSFTTGKHTISGSGTFFYALDLVNTGGTQTDLRWIANATTSTGYNYMFGADFSGSNGDNFFIWNLRINRPAMLYDGVNNITAYNAFTTFDSTGAKVQIKNDFATTNALSINNGKLLIKATGDIFFADGVNMDMGTTTGTKIGLATNEKIGFWNATPVVRPSAYTQTYSTADKTHANFTSADITGITSSTTGSVLAEPSASYTQAEMQQNFRRLQDQYNLLRADLADAKQVINSLIDDLQAMGLVG
jgi:hypothetical protein